MDEINNLTNHKFGKLTVIKKSSSKVKGKHWICQCDCGNIIEVHDSKLRTGHTRSCGCLKRSPSRIDMSGEYGICYTNNGYKFIFDKEDFNLINGKAWLVDNKGYARSQKIKVHRLVTQCPSGMCVDHINNNKLDNRKSNLRICTNLQNSQNSGKMKNNTSGYTGIIFCKDRNIWRARITVNKKLIHLGYFKNIQDAINARKEAEQKYFGEFAYKERRKEKVNE